MGANFYFDKMLPGVASESKERNPKRQLEVFAYGNKLFLRVGGVNQENSGDNRYTVELSKANASDLIEAIDATMNYLAWK